MCRAHLSPDAERAVADLLDDLATALAHERGIPREAVRIGPVDFGSDPTTTAMPAPAPDAHRARF
jgi:hypothetical protein